MKNRNSYHLILITVFSIIAVVNSTHAQSSDTSNYRSHNTDTSINKKYLSQTRAEIGLSEQQAIAFRQFIGFNRDRISKLQKDTSLTTAEKQRRIKAALMQEEQMRNSLLTPEQQQKLKAILVEKRQQKGRGQDLVKQNRELLEHPAKGATFKSTRTIN